MRTLTRREWKSWLRISVLVFIVHTIVTGLLNDWQTFIFRQRDFYSLKSVIEVSQQKITATDISIKFWYPGVLDSLTIPLFLISIFYMSKRVVSKIYAIIFFVLFFALGIYLGNNDCFSYFVKYNVDIYNHGVAFCIYLILWFCFHFFICINEAKDREQKEMHDLLFAIPGLSIGVGLVAGIANGLVTSIESSIICLILVSFSWLTRQIFSRKLWSGLINWFLAK